MIIFKKKEKYYIPITRILVKYCLITAVLQILYYRKVFIQL